VRTTQSRPRTTDLRPWLWGVAFRESSEYSSPHSRTGRSVVRGRLTPFLKIGVFLVALLIAEQGLPASSGRRSFREGVGSSTSRRVDSWQAERLRRVMIPLIQAMDRPCPVDKVGVNIVNESEINAANAGQCTFLVTSGLLNRASDDQLRGVMAHEIAHQDLGHVARAQMLGLGLNIGAALLEQLVPGSGAFAPIAGTLIARGYGRNEEYSADRHAVDILGRAGYSKDVMIDALSWIRQSSASNGGGGFLSTHPALDERIDALRRLR